MNSWAPLFWRGACNRCGFFFFYLLTLETSRPALCFYVHTSWSWCNRSRLFEGRHSCEGLGAPRRTRCDGDNKTPGGGGTTVGGQLTRHRTGLRQLIGYVDWLQRAICVQYRIIHDILSYFQKGERLQWCGNSLVTKGEESSAANMSFKTKNVFQYSVFQNIVIAEYPKMLFLLLYFQAISPKP